MTNALKHGELNLLKDQEFVNELKLIGQEIGLGHSSVEEGARAIQTLIERLAVK